MFSAFVGRVLAYASSSLRINLSVVLGRQCGNGIYIYTWVNHLSFIPSINIIFPYIHVSRLIILREFTPLLLQAPWIYGTFDAFMCFYLSSARRTFGVNS